MGQELASDGWIQIVGLSEIWVGWGRTGEMMTKAGGVNGEAKRVHLMKSVKKG